MKIKDIISCLEDIAPLSLQESYDNAGLITGDPSWEATAALITTDVIEETVDEAIEKKANLIIAHHPLIFAGLKKINGKTLVERTVIKAIKNDVAVYAAHTNIDAVMGGVNSKICDKIGLINKKILSPAAGQLNKLVVFVPVNYAEKLRTALFEAGAGHIGNYDSCSYNLKGEGTFRGGEETNPFVGKKGEVHIEEEIRIEVVFPAFIKGKLISQLINAHPYEEPAYDIYPLNNHYVKAGMGMVGNLKEAETENSFLKRIKDVFDCKVIRHTALLNKKVKRVAVCGGSGSTLLKNAVAAKADAFISSDFKYHQFFEADHKILIADIGHYESEHVTEELFYEVITKKFPNFAVHLTTKNTNPIKYLY